MRTLGHEKIKAVLKSPADLPPASLFLGPAGIGKTTFAKELISSLHHVDVEDLTETKNTIAMMRKLIEEAPRKPFTSEWRVILIDFDRVTRAASDTLLKLLEEPPDHLKIILVSSKDDLPATVVSRCLVFRFEGLTDGEVSQVLQRLGTHEDIADWAAKYSYGSVREAQQLSFNEEKLRIAENMLDALQSGQRFSFLIRIQGADDLTLAMVYKELVNRGQIKHLRMLEANILSKTKLLLLGLSL